MARNKDNFSTIYDQTHNIQIINNGLAYGDHLIHVTIHDLSDSLQIKLKKDEEFLFNYTTNIDLRRFERIRIEQNLDIDFDGFRTNLIEMLQQTTNRQEMYLKCDCENDKCKLFFYGKSKIKSIIYLIIDLELTNSKEIFDEIYNTIQELQQKLNDSNLQLKTTKQIVQNKNKEIEKLSKTNQELIKQFLQQLNDLDLNFNQQLNDYTTKLLNKLLNLSKKLLKLIQDLNLIKIDLNLKTTSNECLIKNFENLKIESIESTNLINNLRRDNQNFEQQLRRSENLIGQLNFVIKEKEDTISNLQTKIDELQADLQEATLIIAEKTTTNDELGKDLVQANQMIVNFNNRYDSKLKELEEMDKIMSTKDKLIIDKNHRFRDLCHEFDEYKSRFNFENENRLRNDLILANKKIEELEKRNGETMKLNELLTRKLSSGNFITSRTNIPN